MFQSEHPEIDARPGRADNLVGLLVCGRGIRRRYRGVQRQKNMAGADLFVLPGIKLPDPGGDDFALGEIGRRQAPLVGRYFVQDLGMFVKPFTIGTREFQPVLDDEVEKLLAVVLARRDTRFPAPQALDILLLVFRKPDGLGSHCGDDRILLPRRAAGTNDRSEYCRGEKAPIPYHGLLGHAHSRSPKNGRHILFEGNS